MDNMPPPPSLLSQFVMSIFSIPVAAAILVGAYKVQRGYNRLAGLDGGELWKRALQAAAILWVLGFFAGLAAVATEILAGWPPAYMILVTWIFFCGPVAICCFVWLFDLDSLGAGVGMFLLFLTLPLLAVAACVLLMRIPGCPFR